MKKRDYKNFAPGSIFHIYNRGNNKENIFLSQEDYKAFLFRLGLGLGIELKNLEKCPLTSLPHSRIRISTVDAKSFKLHAFCLMKNHFHLLVEQCDDTPISKLISQLCTSYAMYVNKKYKRVGHVFQDRFKSVLIESNSQLMWVSAYIHMNPVKDGFATHPADYIWSSYQDFVSQRNLPISHTQFLKSVFGQKNFEKETLALMSRNVLDMEIYN